MFQRFIHINAILIFLLLLSARVHAELYRRAPDVLPGTLPEMREPEFWFDRMEAPDDIILPLQKIAEMNANYTKFVAAPDPFSHVSEQRTPSLSYWWPGFFLSPPDLKNMTPGAVADTVRTRITHQIEFLRDNEFGNALAVEYSGTEIDAFEAEMAFDLIKDALEVREALTVRCSQLRNVPSFQPGEVGMHENGKRRWEGWTVCIVDIATPVYVLHRSLSGEHVFVMSDLAFGWIRAEDIAFADTEELQTFAEPENFIICTGDRVLLYSDENCEYASGWFRMGDRLPLASCTNSREVIVPVRKMNGELSTDTAWLAGAAEVSVGYLPYTRRNIVSTAFKLLDNPYDFTGGWFGRQHETTYRDIFSCFGFVLPYHAGMFTFYGSDERVVDPEVGRDEQLRILGGNEPFVTLQSCGGHCQLFLGEFEGNTIVFDQHGYGYEDEDGEMLEIRRCCIGDMRMPTYFLTRKVTFLELK